MDINIAIQPDGTTHIKNNNYFTTRTVPTINHKLTNKDCYYLIDHPYEILCGHDIVEGRSLTRLDSFNVIYAGEKYTITKGKVPDIFIPDGPGFLKHVNKNGDLEVRILDYFTKGILDELMKTDHTRELVLSIDSMNELEALSRSCHNDVIWCWNRMSVRVKYRGELLPCTVRSGGYGASLEVMSDKTPEVIFSKKGEETSLDRNTKTLMKRFPNVPILVNGEPVFDKLWYGERLDGGKTSTDEAWAIIKKGYADRKFDLTYKLIIELGRAIDWRCSDHMNDFVRMKEIENNPMFDSYTDNVPFKYIRFGYNPAGADPFFEKFYKKFSVSSILSRVQDFYPKKYINSGMEPVFVGSSLISLFGYAEGADYDIITTACDPTTTKMSNIIHFTPHEYHYRSGRVSVVGHDGKKLDLFKTRNAYCYVISKFHVPCVRMFIKGSELFMTPSCMESLYTGVIKKRSVGEIFTRNGTLYSILEKYKSYGFKVVDE